jgi:2-methylcitrate dehydratase PrpD
VSGVIAAEMAARGVKGMHDIAGGWLPVISNETFPERLTEGITADGKFTYWEIMNAVVTKHYATVGPLTTALDATFDLITKHDIKAGDIREIHADCMRRTAIFNQVHPENEIAARASLPYVLAVAVCTRDPSKLLGPGFAPEYLTSKEVRAAAEKVRITDNEQYEQEYPTHSRARVTITLNNGKSFSQEDDRSARRRYLTPTDGDIEDKFRLIATDILGKAKTDEVVKLVLSMEKLPDVRALVAALQP